MKALKIIVKVLSWIFATLLILFAVATFMGRNFGQTICLGLASVSLVYWPLKSNIRRRKLVYSSSRYVFTVLSIVICFTVLSSGEKTTIYTSEENKQKLMEIYDQKLESWPDDTEDIFIETKYGKVHALVCGYENNPPLVMLHAASMGAPSWAENLEPLLENYRIYAIDNIGEGNKSELENALIYPNTGKEIADFYSSILDSLNIEHAPVFGASNGGYIAQVLAYYYPQKVEALALFGPMGITQLTNKSVLMLSIGSIYPFDFIVNGVTHWAIGKDEYCNKKYSDWFEIIVKGTIPSVAMPVPMTKEQKESIRVPVILFLGTNDPIVGDVEYATELAQDYPNIQIEMLDSGHLIAVEQREFVNKRIREFLN